MAKTLVGSVFGRLKVIADAPTLRRSNQTEPRSVCVCDCGNQKVVRNAHLRSGRVVSCGCFARQVMRKHGCWKTREYHAWVNMIQRCINPNHPSFKDYGGRGITVCERWMSSFTHFISDMGKRPDGLTLERLNNNRGYGPENCVWETRKHQQNNTRRNKRNQCHDPLK